jgi:hypothetical protein
MLHIVSQAIPPDNRDVYRRAVGAARAALERVMLRRNHAARGSSRYS